MNKNDFSPRVTASVAASAPGHESSSADRLPDWIPHHRELALEVHARPSPAIHPPAQMTHVAVQVPFDLRDNEFTHLCELARLWNIPEPAGGVAYFGAQHGDLSLRWERHGEFSNYTFMLPGNSTSAFDSPSIRQLEPGWLQSIPGHTIYAAHARIFASKELLGADDLTRFFGDQIAMGSLIGGGAGAAYTDFWIHDDGYARFVVIDRSLTARQAGRTLQRLFDIETYRMLALIALPLAKELNAKIVSWEDTLAELAGQISTKGGDDETIMHSLTQVAAEVESTLANSQSRFGASRAYHDLVMRRIAELREERIEGLQTIEEFMSRRLTPAIATIASAERRLHELSERIGQISTLLSTRVDIARETQNQELLVALNQRAEVQFHLQRAIEGLSIAAIIYYSAGLVGYLAKAAKAIGVHVDVDLAIGISIPIVTLLSFLAVTTAHRRVARLERNYSKRRKNTEA